MTSGPTADNQVGVEGEDDLPGVTTILERLVADGLGPAIGLSADWRTRSGIERVVRLGPEELARRLEVVYRMHHDKLVGYATRILGHRQDAEDVVNEAFARVLRANPDLREPEELVPYLRAAVQNEAFRRGSRSTRERAAHEAQDVVDLDTRLMAPDRPVEDRVCDDLTLAVALQVLSERQRACFVLRFLYRLSVKDTADRLGISEGNVKRICHDARGRLATALAAA